VQFLKAIAYNLIAQVPFELDHKAVVAKTKLGRARLDLGEIQVPCSKLSKNLVQRAGSVGLLETYEARSVVTGLCRHDTARHKHETRLVAGVIFDCPSDRFQSVETPGKCGCDGGGPVRFGVADEPRGLGRGSGVNQRDTVKALLQEPSALGERDRHGDDAADIAHGGSRWCEEIEMDIEHVLELYQQLDVEYEVVKGGTYGALDRILYRDKGGINLATVGRIEGICDRRHGHRFCTGERGDRSERLLTEGALGPQERDRAPVLHRGCHKGRIVTPVDELEITNLSGRRQSEARRSA